jgi:hydrogenase maturation protease
MSTVSRRVLVAGIGNIFLGDDGFGVEVVRRIDGASLPPSVDVVDYGIRGVHLAYDLVDELHDTLIMVDAAPVDGPPGTLAVLDAGAPANTVHGPAHAHDPLTPAAVDGHSLHPQAVLELLRDLGGQIDRVLVVGCRPAEITEHMGLSDPVAAAVDHAVRLVTALARAEAANRQVTDRHSMTGYEGGLRHEARNRD